MGKITVFVQEVTYVDKEVVFDIPDVDVDDALLVSVNDVLSSAVYSGDVLNVGDILDEIREGFGFDAKIISEKTVNNADHSINLNDVY